MKFHTRPINRSTRVLAALVLLGFGAAMLVALPSFVSSVGALLIAATVALLLGKETWRYLGDRIRGRDPYDLSLLKKAPTFQGPSRDDPSGNSSRPDWEAEDGDTIYCHRCDVSMPAAYSICPRCGTTLGR